MYSGFSRKNAAAGSFTAMECTLCLFRLLYGFDFCTMTLSPTSHICEIITGNLHHCHHSACVSPSHPIHVHHTIH